MAKKYKDDTKNCYDFKTEVIRAWGPSPRWERKIFATPSWCPHKKNLLNDTTTTWHWVACIFLACVTKYSSLRLTYYDPILSRFSETVFILGLTSGSPSEHDSATWNTASTSFLAWTSWRSDGSTISDKGLSCSNPFLTHLTKSGTSTEVDAAGEESGDFPVSNSSSTTPNEYTSHFWVGLQPGTRASGAL